MTSRKVSTEAGLAALLAGAAFEEALAVDDATIAAWDEAAAVERQVAQDRAERRRLNLAEQRLRVADRARRLRARKPDPSP